MKKEIYDLIIVGGGCAGLAAGIYAGRAKLKTLILEKSIPGGQVGNTAEVVNYPGIRRIAGAALVGEMHKHALDFGVEFRTAHIHQADFSEDIKLLYADEGIFFARAVIIATGASPRKAGFEGEELFTGRGVAYCATCDGEFFSGLDLFVIGGGYAAVEEALYLTRYAKSITLVVRGKALSLAKTIADKILSHPKITVKYHTRLLHVEGGDYPEKAYFENSQTGETFTYEAAENGPFGIFVFTGYEPATEIFKGQVELNEDGYILTDEAMKTSAKGVFAAGDLRPKILRQIVTATADGAIAATSAEKYVTLEKERLGLPMFEEPPKDSEAKEASEQAAAADSSEKSKAADNASKEGKFVNSEMKVQLEEIFGKLKKEMTIVTILDEGNEKSVEMKEFLEEITGLSSKIKLVVLEKGTDEQMEKELKTDRYPVAAFLDEKGVFTGVKFTGIPGGHEMNSFILAIFHLAGDDGLSDAQREKIMELNKEVKIQVGVSLSCHFCPEVVTAAQSIALQNPLVSAEMIDVALFADLRKKYKIMSVPAAIINDGEKVLFGSRSLDQLLEELAAL